MHLTMWPLGATYYNAAPMGPYRIRSLGTLVLQYCPSNSWYLGYSAGWLYPQQCLKIHIKNFLLLASYSYKIAYLLIVYA